jgi:hypothetical protein
MTPTREDLLRLAACFEAMDAGAGSAYSVYARHARATAGRLAPAPATPRPFAVGDRVRVAEGAWMREGQTGTVEERDADDPKAEYLVRFNQSASAWFKHSELTHADAPDVEAQGGGKLGEGCAAWLEDLADARDPIDSSDVDELRDIASRIRTTLANGAGEVERLRAQLTRSRDLHDEDGRALLKTMRERDSLRAEVERLRENLEATLSSATALATERNEATRERDQLRAELDEAKTRAAMKHGVLRDIAHELGRCHCWDYGCEPADDETLVRRAKELSAAEDERDALRAELDEERKEHKTTRAMWQGLIEKIKELRAELDEARRERDRFRDLWQAAQRDFAAWYIWAGKLCKSPETSAVLREMIDAKLAAAKAGAVVTEDDVRLLRCVVSAPWGSALWSATSVRALADRLSKIVQAREEMGR